MNRRVLLTAVVLLGVLGGGLLVGDLLPGGTSAGPAGDATTTTTRTTDAGGGSPTTRTEPESGDAGATTRSATPTSSSSGYEFTIVAVENCGSTCRDVTARLVNTGESPRENVRVTTKVFADDELLWSDDETVGELALGESNTSTKRVNVGLSGGVAISDNDGYVTIVTVVESASGTTRFSSRRKVTD